MNIACSAWNFSLLSDADCDHAIQQFVDGFRKHSPQPDEKNMQALENDLRALIAWKKKYYPEIRKLVFAAELYYDPEGRLGCTVASKDYDFLVENGLLREDKKFWLI